MPPNPTNFMNLQKISVLILLLFAFLGNLKAQILDDVHYYVTDRKATNTFFEKNFSAKQMADNPMNPLAFINFLQIKQGQTTVNISAQGPFPGIKVGDPKRWEKTLVKPGATNPPVYGVYWLSISTKNLKKTLRKLKKNGVEMADVKIKLPLESNAKFATIWTPDYNLLVLVERPNSKNFAIDHLQFLVSKLEPELQFYVETLGAKIIQKAPHTAKIEVGNHIFVLSEPEGLVIDRDIVIKKDASTFIPGIDHIGFLYAKDEDMTAAYQKATSLGFKGLMQPTKMLYYNKPTPYTFGILFSPEGFQIEFETENGGRYGPRTAYQK